MIFPKLTQKAEDVKAHYDELDHFYRDIWGNHLHHGLWLSGKEDQQVACLQLIERTAEYLNLQKGHKVLDIGCGYGATSEYLANQYQINATGITLSKAQIDVAESNPEKSKLTHYILGDFLKGPFNGMSFDAALAIESSEHMASKERFFQEIFKVLKPGGRFAIAAWLSKEKPNDFENKYLLEPICREGRLPSLLSPLEYLTLIKSAGFSDICFENLSSKVKKTWSLSARRFIATFFMNKQLRRYLFSKRSKDKSFALTIFRIWIAYAAKSMQYGIFCGTKKDI